MKRYASILILAAVVLVLLSACSTQEQTGPEVTELAPQEGTSQPAVSDEIASTEDFDTALDELDLIE